MPHMQDDFPLLMSTLYDHGVRHYPDQEIVSVDPDLSITRTTYGETDGRVRRLATAFSESAWTHTVVWISPRKASRWISMPRTTSYRDRRMRP